MPLWRKLHVSLIENPDFRRMPDDLTRVVWMLLPLVLDREGRGLDLPTWVRSKLFPTRPEVSDGQVAAVLDWLAARGLIERYEVDGERYFRLPRWHAEQGDCNREAPSRYPPPPSQQAPRRPARPEPSGGAAPASAAPAPPDAPAPASPTSPAPPPPRSRHAHERLTSRSRAAPAPETDSDSDSDSEAPPHGIRDHNIHAPRAVVVVPPRPRRERPAHRAEAVPRPPPGPALEPLAAELASVLASPIASRLAARYPERVRTQLAHYRWAERQGRARGPGWLVRAIEEDWPPPPELERTLAAHDTRRYISGRYGAFIQH